MTNSNYAELNQLYDRYKDKGLLLLFPCTTFQNSNSKIRMQVASLSTLFLL